MGKLLAEMPDGREVELEFRVVRLLADMHCSSFFAPDSMRLPVIGDMMDIVLLEPASKFALEYAEYQELRNRSLA
jgi:hypothetical protein